MNINKISLPVHTLLLLVGPSGCGKTTFSKNILIPQLKDKNLNVQYLSSDEIRCEILGKEYWKHDEEMMFASEAAFQLLFKKMECVTSYPINAEFVIVDTTGLAKEFRDSVVSIARKNNYNIEVIVFGYKDKNEFLKGLDEKYDRKVVFNHIKRLNQEVYKDLSKKDFNNIHKIKDKNFENYVIDVSNHSLYKSCHLSEEYEYVIIGDVHGSLTELKNLLEKNLFVIERNKITGFSTKFSRKIILVGDYLDKGKEIKETINFIYENKDWFEIVYANHENFNYKWLKGKIDKKSVPKDVLENWFDSIPLLENDEKLRNRFFELVESSKPFVKTKNYIVTHAPCHIKYLGKLDNKSLKAQYNFRMPDRKEYLNIEDYKKKLEEDLSFIKDESVKNHPYHVFGHRSFKYPLKIKNKIGIDTGADCGGKLSSVRIVSRFSKFFEEVPSLNNTGSKDLFNIFDSKDDDDTFYELSLKDQKRIEYLAKNKVNFISGTMCPASQNFEDNDLESLSNALKYYKDYGVEEVILQIKYMGSRANIYLFSDINKCYATSRNGYMINQDLDLKNYIYKPLLEKFKSKMEEEKIDMILLDGELMPWAALGSGLIDNQFKVVEKGIESELEFLDNNNFEYQIKKLLDSEDYKNFKKESQIIGKQELIAKYNHNIYSTYKCLSEYESMHIKLSDQKEYFDKYREQLLIYGNPDEIHFKPFDILKIVYKDGSEKFLTDKTRQEVFKMVSDDPYLLVNLTDESYLIKSFFFYSNQTVNEKKEGIVVKPNNISNIKNIAPFIKVRNSDYLRIIYGYDYTSDKKYEKLMKQKNIRKKLKTSIKEHEIGMSLLKVPYNNISIENKEYKRNIIKMIGEEKFEKELDPRL